MFTAQYCLFFKKKKIILAVNFFVLLQTSWGRLFYKVTQ